MAWARKPMLKREEKATVFRRIKLPNEARKTVAFALSHKNHAGARTPLYLLLLSGLRAALSRKFFHLPESFCKKAA